MSSRDSRSAWCTLWLMSLGRLSATHCRTSCRKANSSVVKFRSMVRSPGESTLEPAFVARVQRAVCPCCDKSAGDNGRNETTAPTPELRLGGGSAVAGAGVDLGGPVLRLFVVRAADARRPALERGHADGRIQRRAGGLGRRLVRHRCGDRPRPRPGGAGRRRRVSGHGSVRVGGGARTVDVLRGVGRARCLDGDDAVRPRVHRADQALSAALPAGHHRAHAGRRLRQYAIVSGGGLADAVARLARHAGGDGHHVARGGGAAASVGAARGGR